MRASLPGLTICMLLALACASPTLRADVEAACAGQPVLSVPAGMGLLTLDTAPREPSLAITITVGPSELTVDGDYYELAAIEGHLRAQAEQAEKVAQLTGGSASDHVNVLASSDAPARTLVEVLQASHRAGFANASLVGWSTTPAATAAYFDPAFAADFEAEVGPMAPEVRGLMILDRVLAETKYCPPAKQVFHAVANAAARRSRGWRHRSMCTRECDRRRGGAPHLAPGAGS